MHIDEARLLAKGWTIEEIQKTRSALSRAPKSNSSLEHYAFWFIIAITIALNIAIALFLVPALILLPALPLFTVLIITGLGSGTTFTLFTNLLERHSHRRQLISMILVPSMAALTFIAVAGTLNSTGSLKNPFILAAVYSVAFLLPYLIGGKR